MSEYQYYEFVALDRPLTAKQMAELRAISTRAEISPTRFRNEYHWGDLRADPAKLVESYFDAHVYFANWGTHRLMLRLPVARVDTKGLRRYFVGSASTRIAGKHLIIDLSTEDEERDFEDGDCSLAALAPLRAELMQGDLRAAYLAWLLGVQAGDIAEETVEPPVPPGLSELTAAQDAMVDFLRIDRDLISAAAEGSDTPPVAPRSALLAWAIALAPRAKDEWLRRAIDEPDVAIGGALLQAFLRAEAKPVKGGRRRTIEALRGVADGHRDQRERAEVAREQKAATAAAAARNRHLNVLAGRGDEAWVELDALIEKRAYGEAVTLAIDLRDLAKRDNASASFAASFEAMRKRRVARRGFFDRWKRETRVRG